MMIPPPASPPPSTSSPRSTATAVRDAVVNTFFRDCRVGLGEGRAASDNPRMLAGPESNVADLAVTAREPSRVRWRDIGALL